MPCGFRVEDEKWVCYCGTCPVRTDYPPSKRTLFKTEKFVHVYEQDGKHYIETQEGTLRVPKCLVNRILTGSPLDKEVEERERKYRPACMCYPGEICTGCSPGRKRFANGLYR